MQRSSAVPIVVASVCIAIAAVAPRSEAAGPHRRGPIGGVSGQKIQPFQLFPSPPGEHPLAGIVGGQGSFTTPNLSGTCARDMVEVEGDYCPYVFQRCKRWLDEKTQLQCTEFEPSSRCHMKPIRMHFCIDRFEWPNRVGERPVLMVSWNEAKASCEAAGKRLCTDREWTLACEGRERLPYPYGYKRDPAACNIDKPYPVPRPELIYDPRTQAAELARLDQREPSGARPRCVSPYGVYDMAGNVDEWVVNESQHGFPHKSGLKGGYWGPVRTRCRPMTTAHEETFRYYQIGFRCCGDASSNVLPDGPLSGRAPLAAR